MRYRAQVPTHSFAFVGADEATAGPGVTDAIASADVVLLAPSNPVVSIGAILAIPGIRGALRSTAARVIGYSPIVAGKPLRGMADECLSVIGVASTSEAVGGYYGAALRRRHPGRLAGARGRPRRDRGRRGALGAAADDRPGDDGRNGACRTRSGGGQAVTEHGSAAAIELLPVTGLPEFRPGDDLAAALAAAAPWLRDDDVVVVTSKVLSKCEGRIVAAPQDPEERDALRRKLIDDEAVRVLARKGRTLITENNLGLVQAAAGVDGSNVGATELALLPVDPDGSAAALRAGLRERLGVTVGVVVTDTMGRAWRNGQIDAAIGAAGLTVLHGYAGAHDVHGNELVVTEVAVADEIAAAADLVKGKLTGIPGRGGARTDAAGQRIQCPHPAAARRGGPVLARHRGGARDGPRPGPAAAPVGPAVQRRTRRAGDHRGRCRGGADRARPAPHPPGAVRVDDRQRTPDPAARPDEGPVAFRPDRRRQGGRRRRTPGRPRPDPLRRTRTGDPVPGSRRCAQLSGRHPHRRRTHHVHRRGRRGRAGAACRAGRPRRRQLLDRLDDLRRRPGARRAGAARRLGAVGRHRDRLPGRAVRSTRARRRPTGLLVRK